MNCGPLFRIGQLAIGQGHADLKTTYFLYRNPKLAHQRKNLFHMSQLTSIFRPNKSLRKQTHTHATTATLNMRQM